MTGEPANNDDLTQVPIIGVTFDPTTQGPEGTTPAPSLIGKVRYFGDYELLAEISRGGMGVVYKARQVSINRLVALKMILAGQLASAAEVQRFHAEAKAAGNLDHANIVPIYEIGQHDGFVYYSMKLIEGGSLAQAIARLRERPADLAARQADFARVMADVAKAVHHAHQRGILHRDLKPANILLQTGDTASGGRKPPDGDALGESTIKQGAYAPRSPHPWPRDTVPVITDFGLAKHVKEDTGLTQSGAILGTPSYMAPEQARAEKTLTTAIDVYSLGAILYEALTGKPPFTGTTLLETVMRVVEVEPEGPRSVNPHVDSDLETICLKCLQKEPGKRYTSAAAFAEDLDRWLAGEPILARPVGSGERFWRWCRRKPLVAGLIAAVIFSMLAGICTTTYFARKAIARAAESDANARRADLEAEHAKDILARSLFDQVQALRRSTQAGRRAKALRLLKDAEKLSTRPRREDLEGISVPGIDLGLSAKLPSLLELRNEAVALLLMQDARLAREFSLGLSLTVPAISPDGLVAAAAWYELDTTKLLKGEKQGSKEGVRVVDLGDESTSGQTWGRWEVPFSGIPGSFRGTISPDKKLIVSTVFDAKTANVDIVFRELKTGSVVKALAWPKESDTEVAITSGLAFSPDGRFLAGAKLNSQHLTVSCWDLTTGTKSTVAAAKKPASNWVTFDSQGRWLAFPSGDKTITLWDPEKETILSDLVLPMATAGQPVFDRENRLLAVPCRNRGDNKTTLLIWDIERKVEQSRFLFKDADVSGTGRTGFAFQPVERPGGLMAMGDGQNIVLVDPREGKELFRVETGHSIGLLAWQPDGRHLVSAGIHGSIKVWELSPEPPIAYLHPKVGKFSTFCFSPDGNRLALAGVNHLKTWLIDGKTGKVEREFALDIGGPATVKFESLLFRPDGKQLAAMSGSVAAAWGLDTGMEVARMEREGLSFLNSIAFSAGGHLLAARGSLEKLAVWDVNDRHMLWQNSAASTFLGFLSPDARFLAGYPLPGTAESQFTLWSLADNQKLGPYPMEGLPSQLAFSPDRTLLAISYKELDLGKGKAGDTGLGVWQIPSGIKLLDRPNPPVFHLAFSPDSKFLAVVSQDGTVKLWDPGYGEEIFSWPIQAKSLAFTPDGSSLAVSIPSSNPLDDRLSIQFLNLAVLRTRLAEMKLDWNE